MRVVTVLAAVGSGALATVLSLLLTGTAATASTTNDTPTQQHTQDTQSSQGYDNQLQAPDQAPAQTYLGGGHASSGGT